MVIEWELTASDYIELAGIIASLITGVIAVVVSVKALKQNAKMLEESTRPYVAVYREYIQVISSVHEYLVIKNFGNTGAIIDSLSIAPPYDNLDTKIKANIFEHINGAFIAPKQSFSTVLFPNAFCNNRTGITKITIAYHSNMKSYSDAFTFNEDARDDIRLSKTVPAPSKSIQRTIASTAEEILRRNL